MYLFWLIERNLYSAKSIVLKMWYLQFGNPNWFKIFKIFEVIMLILFVAKFGLFYKRCDQNRFPVRTPLGARSGLGTQPRYEAPGDLRVEYVKRKWLTSGEWGCLLDNGPKLAVG